MATVAQYGAPDADARAVWKRAPRTTTEQILSNSKSKVVQGLHLRSTICVSYTRKRRDGHDLPWRRSKSGLANARPAPPAVSAFRFWSTP